MTSPTIFIVATGVSGNLGDAVIRRRVTLWFTDGHPRHVYVGRTTEAWIEQLQLPAQDHVYRAADRRRWLRELAFGRGRRVLVYDPGEVPLGRAHLKSELFFLVLGLWLRLRRCPVIRPPRAISNAAFPTSAFHRWGCYLSRFAMWREEKSRAAMRHGDLTPDTAFGEPARPALPAAARRLAVSLRGPRTSPPDRWINLVGRFAREHELMLTVLSQVDEDVDRSQELADRFGSAGFVVELVRWEFRETDLERERALRELYRGCDLVVSDRLHVLILAAKAGAVPVELVERPVAKVTTHFATIGVHDVSLDVATAEDHEIIDFLNRNHTRADEIATSLEAASLFLDKYVARMRADVGLPRATVST